MVHNESVPCNYTEAAWGLKGADSFSQKIFLPKTLKHSAG